MTSHSYDICVIGSGIAGALLAAACAEEDLNVVMIDAGRSFDPPKRVEQMRRALILGGSAWQWEIEKRDLFVDSSQGVDYSLNDTRMKAVGGSTLHWGGVAQRLHESDFRRAERHGYGVDWPIRYADLEPYYALAESEIGVSGNDRESPVPRSSPFPLPPFPDSYGDAVWRDAAKRLGIAIGVAPFAKNSEPYRGRPACEAFATCYICPINAQYSADVHVRRALATSRCTLLKETVARRIETDSTGTVRTVHAETLDGEQLEVQAAKVVVACHAVESARLLMLSRTGNLDHVGQNLMEHWYTGARGFNTRGRSYPGQLGFHLLQSTAYYDAPSDGPVTGAIKLEFICGGEPLVALNSAEDAKWGRDLAEFDDREFGRWLTAAVETEQMPNPNSRVSLDDTRKDLFGDPVPNIHFAFTGRDTETQKRARRVAETVLEAAGAKDLVRLGRSIASHHLGTCRMSAREEDGVVDQNLKVWGSDNLFVLGSSVFPTGGAVQPTLTIAALAMRLAAHFHASA